MMPTMQEIDEWEERGICTDSVRARLFAAARRGVEADAEIERLRQANEDAIEEIAALKLERDEAVRRERELAEECVNAWRSAVDWSEYASAYFQEKWDAVGDLSRCKAAEFRLNAMFANNDQRGPAAQVNAGDGSDAASQARCEQSGPHPQGESDE